jgi:FAD/FMN-containing dehydrogenase
MSAAALQAALGPTCRFGPGGLTWTPAGVPELQAGLGALASQGARLGREVVLDRSALRELGAPREASMTVDAGAGVTLDQLEVHLAPAGLSLGALGPGAGALTLAAFLEGRRAGLRAVPLGRLEPLCTRLEAVLPGGQRLRTSDAPRSATGPELGALVLGAEGRLGLVVSATLRCVPRAEAREALALEVADAASAVELVRRFLARGGRLASARLRPAPLTVELTLEGTAAAVARDRALAGRVAAELGARATLPAAATPGQATPGQATEREASWEAVERALVAGAPLALYRLSLASALVVGDVEGMPLDAAGAWEPAAAVLRPLAADVLGGAP